MSKNNKLSWALSLAALGYRVFPVFPIYKDSAANKLQKFPALKQWPKLASKAPETIRTWWSGTHPFTNKKGKTSTVPAHADGGICTTGFCVIDVDVKHGDAYVKSLEQLKAAGLPDSPMVVTTLTKGWHQYYRVPPNTKIKSGDNILPGIDTRGEGGYVVMPGSGSQKYGYYTAPNLVPLDQLPVLPQSVVSLLSSLGAVIGTTQEQLPDYLQGADLSATEAASSATSTRSEYSDLPATIFLGSHDSTMHKYAAAFRARGYSKEHARAILYTLAERCEPNPDEPNPLQAAKDKADEKLEHVWANYEAGQETALTTIVTPDGPVLVDKLAVIDLQEMIENFMYIEKKQRVAKLASHPLHAVTALEDFKKSMTPYTTKQGSNTVQTANLWLKSHHRQTVWDDGFLPEDDKRVYTEDGEKFFNCYAPPTHQEVPAPDPEKFEMILTLFKYVLDSEETYKFFMQWLAFGLQKPAKRIPWCFLIITTRHGVGKNLMHKVLEALFGAHNTSIVSNDVFSDNSQFNDYLSRRLLVTYDEINAPRKAAEKLRTQITATEMRVNRKYGKQGPEKVYANTMALSNSEDAIYIDKHDRRFYVSMTDRPPLTSDEYAVLWAWIDDKEAVAHLYHYMKRQDISAFRWSEHPPMTMAKRTMAYLSKCDVEQALQDAIDNKCGAFKYDVVDSTLAKKYLEQLPTEEFSRLSSIHVGRVLTRISTGLPQREQYTVPTVEGGKALNRVRCRCVRTPDKWLAATPDAIGIEYAKAREAADDVVDVEAKVATMTTKVVKR